VVFFISLLFLGMVNIADAEGLPLGLEKFGVPERTASNSQDSDRLRRLTNEQNRRIIDMERRLAEVHALVSRLLEENRSLKETIFSFRDAPVYKPIGRSESSPLAPVLKPATADSSSRGGADRSSMPETSRAVRPLDLAPSNPFAMPGTTGGFSAGSNSIHLNNRMLRDILPPIPNLELGYIHHFGKEVNTGRLSVDYVLPLGVGVKGAAFVEGHGEFINFWKTIRRTIFGQTEFTNTETSHRPFFDRTDLSIGGGYRRIFRDMVMLGVNGFYDVSQLGDGRWYGSPGFGFEMAGLGAGNDMVDLTVNYYGNLFQGRNSIINAFRNGAGNYDIQVGYSIELWDEGPDFRVKATGYRFDAGSTVYGWNAGAQVTSRDGRFSVKAEAGHDRINDTYYTVAGFVNVGVDFGNLLSGQSPFTEPEPIFRSPRNLRRLLSTKVKRDWHQPATEVAAKSLTRSRCGIVTIVGEVSQWDDQATIYVNGTPAIHVTWAGFPPTPVSRDISSFFACGINTVRVEIYNGPGLTGGQFELRVNGFPFINTGRPPGGGRRNLGHYSIVFQEDFAVDVRDGTATVIGSNVNIDLFP
jgi:hypothetical protein